MAAISNSSDLDLWVDSSDGFEHSENDPTCDTNGVKSQVNVQSINHGHCDEATLLKAMSRWAFATLAVIVIVEQSPRLVFEVPSSLTTVLTDLTLVPDFSDFCSDLS